MCTDLFRYSNTRLIPRCDHNLNPDHTQMLDRKTCGESGGTSRNALALIRATGVEPEVIHYLETPPSRAELVSLVQRMGISPRDLLREKGTPYAELGLGDPSLTNDQIIDAMLDRSPGVRPTPRRVADALQVFIEANK